MNKQTRAHIHMDGWVRYRGIGLVECIFDFTVYRYKICLVCFCCNHIASVYAEEIVC